MAENATPPAAHERPSGADAPPPPADQVVDGRPIPASPPVAPQGQAREQPRQRPGGERQEREVIQKRATYLGLIGLFAGLFVAFSAREGRGRRAQHPPIAPFDFVMLAFATFRLARIAAFDQVTEPIRAPVTEPTPGGGTRPKGRGARRVLGELISCPLCAGVWIAAALTYGLLVVPRPTRVFTTIFGAAGVAETLNVAVSTLDSADRLAQQRRRERGTAT